MDLPLQRVTDSWQHGIQRAVRRVGKTARKKKQNAAQFHNYFRLPLEIKEQS